MPLRQVHPVTGKFSMPERLMIGTRIRERRVLNGMRQTELARQAGISPSYLNLIEHNRRRIGGKTLLKLAEALEVEPSRLTEGAEAAVVGGLREAASDSETAERDRIEEFAGRFPGWAGLLVDLHRRTEALERTIDTLTDRLAHDPFLADSLHEVISSVTAIRATASILVETEQLEPEWQARFHRNINEDAARLTEGAQALVRYLETAPRRDADLTSPQDEMHAVLAARDYHFSELERPDAHVQDVARLVAAEARSGLSAPAQNLLATVLTRYLEDARALPLSVLRAQLNRLGPEPDRLAAATGAGLALVFQSSWNTVPGMAASSTTVGNAPSMAMMALPVASWPVTTRWTGGRGVSGMAVVSVGRRRCQNACVMPASTPVERPPAKLPAVVGGPPGSARNEAPRFDRRATLA